jgi:hypothetical protein
VGISAIDFCRLELCVALWELHTLFAPDEDVNTWETIGGVARSVIAHAEQPLTEAEALTKVQQVIADGWDIPREELTPEAKLFGDRLRLEYRGRFRW